MFLAGNLNIDHVTWHTERNEHYALVDMEQTLSFGCNSLDDHVLQQWQWLMFSCHSSKMFLFKAMKPADGLAEALFCFSQHAKLAKYSLKNAYPTN